MRLKNYKIVLIFFAIIQFHLGYSHGDLSKRIKQKTLEIKVNPTDSSLYYQRGFLYHQHEEYKNAVSDYLKSKSLGFIKSNIDLRLANSYKELNQLDLSLKTINEFLSQEPKNVRGIQLKGQILTLQNNYIEAKECYDYIIKHMSDIRPEDFIMYSDFTVSSLKDYNRAIAIIENGLLKLGENNVALKLKKLEYYIASEQNDLALQQYDNFINKVNRKEFWYYKKAKFLYDIKEIEKSKIVLEQSKQSINILPNRFKNLKAIKDLINDINQLDKALNHEH